MHFITVSEKFGSGGSEVARQVAQKMGYRFFDTDAIDVTAGELGFRDDVMEVAEKAPSVLSRLLSNRPSVDLERMSSVVYELAKNGDAVFLGWGTHMLLKAFDCALHVRIIAPREKRIQNLVDSGFSPDDAPQLMEKGDHDRGSFLKFAFGVDWDDASLYDLTLNLDKVSVDLAVETVMNVARSSEIKACSIEAMTAIELMALNNRVDAAITDAGLSYGHATALSTSVPTPGKVELSGFVEDEAYRARVEEVVRRVKGVQSVENRIRVISSTRFA